MPITPIGAITYADGLSKLKLYCFQNIFAFILQAI